MKRHSVRTIIAAGVLITASSAATAEGFYYGASLGYGQLKSASVGTAETEAEVVTFGGLLGFSGAVGNGHFWAFEANVNRSVDGEMGYSGFEFSSCTDQSPDWCDVELIARARGIYGMPVSADYDLFGSVGLAFVSGVAEDGPGNYVDTTATGATISAGIQREIPGVGTGRLEVVYDTFDKHSPEEFEKTLENVSLVASILF